MKRVFLFIATNLAIIVRLSITLSFSGSPGGASFEPTQVRRAWQEGTK